MDSHPYSYETSIFTLGAPHADMLKKIFDHIPQFSLSKKNAVLDQNLS